MDLSEFLESELVEELGWYGRTRSAVEFFLALEVDPPLIEAAIQSLLEKGAIRSQYEESGETYYELVPPIKPKNGNKLGRLGRVFRYGSKRAAAQKRLSERGLKGIDRECLVAAGHESWNTKA